jgi:hypothetical protein
MGKVRHWVRYGVIVGDVVYVLWIVRNGINEGFSARPVEAASLVGLLILLVLNAVLLARRDA